MENASSSLIRIGMLLVTPLYPPGYQVSPLISNTPSSFVSKSCNIYQASTFRHCGKLSKQVREHFFLALSAFSCFFICIAQLQKKDFGWADGRMELGWDGAYELPLWEIRSIRRKRSWPVHLYRIGGPWWSGSHARPQSAGEEVALSVLKCGDDGGCVRTT